ncbi:hypothetical protein [Streptosporangium sp. OZ121]|uniref:hypothetical protein n=1 Tax=Streptosporangium sp. OZ121 TaxID=3444183 RepID=UPI003F78F6F7
MTDRINLENASPREVESILLAHAEEREGWESWTWWRDEAGESQEVTRLGTVTVVESIGGGEGDGESTSVAVKVTQDGVTRYFRKTGYYGSYGGSDWDGEVRSVWPTTKTVTVYE